ncbi:LAMI_0F07140g1_1 [Lachancea mirantina]|uniref:LAMI_0F07140g1_1 n=1 Tax=Lachancea mirantina TaxID=1230905 RepID=A0A1G4JZI0_9SACH|nr:LAMI_0F07140g1_1 [Lachancea mirantina]
MGDDSESMESGHGVVELPFTGDGRIRGDEDRSPETFAFPVIKIEEFQEPSDDTPSKSRRRSPRRSGRGTNAVSSGSSGGGSVTRRRRSSSRASSKNLKSSTDISPASMIFRNLLILEDDLRSQARGQQLLKWQFTIFLSVLMGIAAYAFCELYFSQRNIRGLFKVFLQFIIIFILVTVILFHLSGEYKRTIVIPRKFFTSTNKGIRQFNIKLVKVKSSVSDQIVDIFRWLCRTVANWNIFLMNRILPKGLIGQSALHRFWALVAIRSQPRIGAVDVKLVMNPRAFSAEVREGWEIYRDEFWAREGARRRKVVNELSPKRS